MCRNSSGKKSCLEASCSHDTALPIPQGVLEFDLLLIIGGCRKHDVHPSTQISTGTNSKKIVEIMKRRNKPNNKRA
jgi:hypothetical protein